MKDVQRIEVNIISPKLNTVITHGRCEVHERLYKDIHFTNPNYTPGRGRLWTPSRTFSTSIAGYPRLDACKFTVTFIDEEHNAAWSRSDKGWTSGYSWAMTPGNANLTFEPTKIIAEISFPDSTFVIRETFTVDEHGKLQGQGPVRKLQK